jgi:hypothetical protein
MRTGLSRSYIYTSDQLADLVVTGQKIADSAISSSKLAASSVGVRELSSVIEYTRAKAYRSAYQSYNGSTYTKVNFDTKIFDLLNAYDDITNYRYTIPIGFNGQFVVHAQVEINYHTTAGNILLCIYKNGSTVCTKSYNYPGSSYYFSVDITAVLDLVAGDYIEIFINDGQSGTINIGSDRTFFEIFRLP